MCLSLQLSDEANDSAPVLVYMPLVKNDSYLPSFDPAGSGWFDFDKFSFAEVIECHINNIIYTIIFSLNISFDVCVFQDNFETLCGLAKYNFVQNEANIKAMLLKIIERKRTRRRELKCFDSL